MDRRLFDILWEVYRGRPTAKKPIQIISSYRSPATNAILRRRSSGGGAFSASTCSAHAMDFFIPDVPLEQIRYAGPSPAAEAASGSTRPRDRPLSISIPAAFVTGRG